MIVGISRIHFPVTSLGPGKRLGIWFQGCSIKCTGCISLDTWAVDTGLTHLEDLVAAVAPLLCVAEGITISGGEPFDQPDALHALLIAIRERTDSDILVYSGYSITDIELHLERMSGLIDALITEPFRINESQTLPLRGSDNQVLSFLTELGRAKFAYAEKSENARFDILDIMFDDSQTLWIAGIPKRGDVFKFVELLREQGLDSSATAYSEGFQSWKH